MSSKIELHEIKCPKCNKTYTVQTPAYKRKLNNPKYGMLCTSCRAKVLWEEMSPEQKQMMKEKSKEGYKEKLKNMTEEEKKKLSEKRSEISKNMWANMSAEKMKELSEIRSKNQKALMASKTPEQKKEIGEKISKSKKEHFANMTDEEREKFLKFARERQQKYWNSLSDEEKKLRMQKVTEKNIEAYNKLTEEEKQNRLQRMYDGREKYWNSLSKEERDKLLKQRVENYKIWYENLSDEEKKEKSEQKREIMLNYWENLSDEEYNKIIQKRSEVHQERINKMTKEEYQEYCKFLSNTMKNYWNNLTEEEKEKKNQAQRDRYINNPELREQKSQMMKDYWKNISKEKYNQWRQNMKEGQRKYIDNMPSEEYEKYIKIQKERGMKGWNILSNYGKDIKNTGLYKWRQSLTPEQWQIEIDKQHQWIKEMSPEQLQEHMKKVHKGNRYTGLNIKFEKFFNNSNIKERYYIIPEYITKNDENGEIYHSWDYAIFNKDNKELIALIDLDGAYFHADICDYNVLYSEEKYDKRRTLTIPNDIKTKVIILYEKKFKQSFEYLTEVIDMDFNSYNKYYFNQMRSIPFPIPHYTDNELSRSMNDLIKFNYENDYGIDVSLNTRLGDRLIHHFHNSIYSSHIKGKISPQDAWYDDKILKKCIENHTIYHSYLNHNKILQGFNVSKIAPKVSVFSAGRAKMLIYKYLNEYNTIFDPFSGFSGRMLGTLSLGKKYIGQDISEVHINESKKMIDFLSKFKLINKDDVNIDVGNTISSTGTYECLFTCPPCEDKEIWIDTPVSKLTCDEWIDICLKNFKCKKYLFVVDNTEKYKDYIVDIIENKSHLNGNDEYIILI